MSTDFFINFDFKNDWIIAVWKFQLWISSQHKMWRGSVCAPYTEIYYKVVGEGHDEKKSITSTSRSKLK